jgi:hypothetical protein
VSRVRTRAAVLALAVAVAVLVSPMPTHTWQATAVTAVIGVIGAVLAAPGRLGRAGGRRRVTLRSAAPWGALVLAVSALEIGALLDRRSASSCPPSRPRSPAGSRSSRAGGGWAGWHFLARSSAHLAAPVVDPH